MGETVIHSGFEWDADKAAANVAAHGVSFEEAATVLVSLDTIEKADLADASRVLTIGFSGAARLLLLVSTEVTDDRVRIISARKATPAEEREFAAG